MKTIWAWIKKYWLKILLISLGIILALVIPPLVVHIMFKTEAQTPFFENTWGPGDLLTYIAGFEAFVGTVYLGNIAVNQNKRNIDINDRLLKIEEASSAFMRFPSYRVGGCLLEQTSLSRISDFNTIMFYSRKLKKEQVCSDENLNQLFYKQTFDLENVSDYNITISLKKLVMTSLANQALKSEYNTLALAQVVEHFSIAAKQKLQLSFLLFNDELIDYQNSLVECDLLIKNILGEEYILSLEFLLCNTNELKIFKIMTEKIAKSNSVTH